MLSSLVTVACPLLSSHVIPLSFVISLSLVVVCLDVVVSVCVVYALSSSSSSCGCHRGSLVSTFSCAMMTSSLSRCVLSSFIVCCSCCLSASSRLSLCRGRCCCRVFLLLRIAVAIISCLPCPSNVFLVTCHHSTRSYCLFFVLVVDCISF